MPTMKIGSKIYEWDITQNGVFYTLIPVEGSDPARVNSDTLEGLKTELKKFEASAGRAEIGLKLVLKHPGMPAESVTIRAMHRTQRGIVLITRPNGEKSSEAMFRNNQWYRDMSDDEIAEINRQQEAIKAAQADLVSYLSARQIDLYDKLRELGQPV